jgi:hypothetical protein
MGGDGGGREDASFSEEKEAKRLLIVLSRTSLQTTANKQKFFGSFFQKRTNFLSRRRHQGVTPPRSTDPA